MFDVILFGDAPEPLTKTRGYGAYRLATHIRQQGYSCIVIDFISALDYETFKEIIDLTVGPNTLMVGISTTWLPYRLPGQPPQLNDPGWTARKPHDENYQLEDESEFSSSLSTALANGKGDSWMKYVKDKNPKSKIVVGGAKVNWYMDFNLVDYYVVGLGETMVLDLLNSLSGKGPKRLFNKVINYDIKAQAPVWDFRESCTSYVEHDFLTPNETLAFEVGRGCRFKCKFCSYPLIGQKNIGDYLKHSEVIRNELVENYNRWGITNYFIVDDTFNDTTEKLQMFLDVTRSLPFKIKFWCYLRIDLIAAHPEQIPMLKEMGMESCYFGIETFNEKASAVIGKGMKAEKRKKALNDCKKVWGDQVHIQAGFMVGLPYEDSASILDTAKWLASEDNPIDECWIFPLSIAGKHQLTENMFKSEFDLNYEQWGYYMPDPEVFWIWAKKDDTDISTYHQAETLASDCWNEFIKHRNRPNKGNFNLATLDHPILKDRPTAKSLSNEEYNSLIENLDRSNLYYSTVDKEYFKPLILELTKRFRSSL